MLYDIYFSHTRQNERSHQCVSEWEWRKTNKCGFVTKRADAEIFHILHSHVSSSSYNSSSALNVWFVVHIHIHGVQIGHLCVWKGGCGADKLSESLSYEKNTCKIQIIHPKKTKNIVLCGSLSFLHVVRVTQHRKYHREKKKEAAVVLQCFQWTRSFALWHFSSFQLLERPIFSYFISQLVHEKPWYECYDIICQHGCPLPALVVRKRWGQHAPPVIVMTNYFPNGFVFNVFAFIPFQRWNCPRSTFVDLFWNISGNFWKSSTHVYLILLNGRLTIFPWYYSWSMKCVSRLLFPFSPAAQCLFSLEMFGWPSQTELNMSNVLAKYKVGQINAMQTCN